MLVNTKLFSASAQHFLKHGYYCADPPGSAPHYHFWREELDKCIHGTTIGDVSITGHHYFYLNYVQIKLTMGGNKKVDSFPNFWDGDYEFFWLQDIARNGITDKAYAKLQLTTSVAPEHRTGGRHMIVGKSRRKGYSYKNAGLITNIFNTERRSYSLLCAFDKKYLYPKGIMAMVTDNMNFLNEHTAWGKRRTVIDKQNHRKASYLEYVQGQTIEKGYRSEVEAITFKDNPDAARGKDASIVIFEECGAFDNLKASYLATKPTVEDGGITTGQMILFGTGGDMSGGTIDFESMFYNPEAYNLMPVTNVWDDNANHTTCGYFVPSYRNKVGFMDKDGNSLIENAIQSEEATREQIKRDAKDAGVLDKHITEYPFTPKEAFLQHNSNIFPTAMVSEWRNQVMRNGTYKSLGVAGNLVETSGGLKFRPSENARPIEKFPHTKGDNLQGCVVMYQSPYRHAGVIPFDLYIIVHDPYAQDSGGESLGAAYVIKRVNPYSQPDDMIVASYVGRPDTQDEYNYNLFLLAEYYNARIGFENDRGEVIAYAKRHKKLQYLLPETEIFDKTDNVRIRKLGRTYGSSMGSIQRKGQAEIYFRDWLKSPRGKTEDGDVKRNLHMIHDIALLDEILRYNRSGNFDRVSAMLVGMFHLKDMHAKEIEVLEESDETGFFDRPLFQ
jgi:hypothetical protein